MEKNSEGESFDQEGTWNCYFDMDNTVMRIELKFTVTRSSGSYDSLPRKRNFTEYIVYNTSRNMYQVFYFDAGNVSSANSLLGDIKNKALKYYSSFYHPVRKITLDGVSMLKAVNTSECIHTQEFNAVESGFKEFYNSTLKRIK